MRRVVVYELLSLDGVAEDPDEFLTNWDEVMEANLTDVIKNQDAVILGRRSFDEWARFWPGIENHPFASFINPVTKFIATSTPLDPDWANATVIDRDLIGFVQDLKNEPGGDIGVHASISVAQTLLAAGVVDDLRLLVAPHITGHGRRLLDSLPTIELELVAGTLSPTGSLLLNYRIGSDQTR